MLVALLIFGWPIKKAVNMAKNYLKERAAAYLDQLQLVQDNLMTVFFTIQVGLPSRTHAAKHTVATASSRY